MIKKISIILLIAFISALPSGCWSREEVTDLAIVLGAGVDWTPDGRIRLTLQIAKPGAFPGSSDTGGQESASFVVFAEGKTIAEAERNLASQVPRRIFWGHCVVLVIGEEMAKQGTDLIMNFFFRGRQPRETIWMTVTKGEAKDFMGTYSELAKTSAQATAFLTKMKTSYSVQLWEFDEMRNNKGIQPVVTLVAAKEVDAPSQDNNSPAPKQVEINGIAVFKEDKMIGGLDIEETKGFLWLKGEVVHSIISVSDPDEPDREVSIRVQKISTKIIPEYDGRNLRFNVKIKMDGDIIEQQSEEDLAKSEKIRLLEKEMAEEVKNNINATLEKIQHLYGVDVFGFGLAFHRQYKKDWPELKDLWDDKFTRSEVNLSVEVKLQGFGLQSKAGSGSEE